MTYRMVVPDFVVTGHRDYTSPKNGNTTQYLTISDGQSQMELVSAEVDLSSLPSGVPLMGHFDLMARSYNGRQSLMVIDAVVEPNAERLRAVLAGLGDNGISPKGK